MRNRVQIYVEATCECDAGPGSWEALLVSGSHRQRLVGSSPRTTFERMSLTAALHGVRALKRPCAVEIHLPDPAVSRERNRDLWQALRKLADAHRIRFVRPEPSA